jgi:dienelactone hydrolase
MWKRRFCILAAGPILAVMAAQGPALAQSPVAAATPIGGGPFKAVMEMDSGLPTHTLYHPADRAVGAPLPIVVWGNGACVNVGNRFRGFLSEIASYGYLVIAIGPMGPASAEARPQPIAAPPPAGAAPASPPALGPPQSHAQQLVDAINWAQAENERAGSRFFHRLDPGKIAVMGQSCGGAQAIEASADPRVTTTVLWNSGLFPTVTTMGGGKPLTKADLARLHAPTAYIGGDPQDISFVNADDDYARINGIPVFRGWERGVPHEGTYWDADGGEFGGVAVAWLNWRLKGDARAGRMFSGPDCGLCVNPRWVVARKNMP